MVSNNTPLLPSKSTSDPSVEQSSLDANLSANADELSNNGLSKIAIGVLVGATLGGVAGALANPGVVDRINRSIRGVGDAMKRAAANVTDDVQHVGEAVHSVSTGVNDTVREVGSAVKGAAAGINSTMKNTVNTVKNTADTVNDTVKDTVGSVKDATEGKKPLEGITASAADNGTLYKLVPVNPTEQNADSN
ncbi:hypothetical protein C7B61_06155 [filamentous cyanobacterium CCP1]|nr:hypothetical protein C7B76_13105 [filamentous cyanobacterium CCP2]PSB67440.1 hypothetical protein C7B61_06155 [filamentous cyanobacterium CCP1]